MSDFEKALEKQAVHPDRTENKDYFHGGARWAREWCRKNDWERKLLVKEYTAISEFARKHVDGSKMKLGESYIEELKKQFLELKKEIERLADEIESLTEY